MVVFRGLLSGGNANGLDAYWLEPGFRISTLRGNAHFQVTRSDVPMLLRIWNTGAVQPTLVGGYHDYASVTFPADA
jgi:hypothetical protein